MKQILLGALLLLPLSILAQRSTYIGIDAGPKFDIYQSVDNGDNLYTKPFLSTPIIGLNVGHELSDHFIVETGFYLNNYNESYRIRGDFGYSSSNAITAYQIPIRLKGRLPLIQDKLHLMTTVGYTFAINNDYGSFGTGSSFSSTTSPLYNTTTRTEDYSNYSLRRYYGLIETGIGLELQLNENTSIYLNGNYMAGLHRVVETNVNYSINDGPTQNAMVFSNGDYFSVVFGLRFRIGGGKTTNSRDRRVEGTR